MYNFTGIVRFHNNVLLWNDTTFIHSALKGGLYKCYYKSGEEESRISKVMILKEGFKPIGCKRKFLLNLRNKCELVGFCQDGKYPTSSYLSQQLPKSDSWSVHKTAGFFVKFNGKVRVKVYAVTINKELVGYEYVAEVEDEG